jgi:hypothetical protein
MGFRQVAFFGFLSPARETVLSSGDFPATNGGEEHHRKADMYLRAT